MPAGSMPYYALWGLYFLWKWFSLLYPEKRVGRFSPPHISNENDQIRFCTSPTPDQLHPSNPLISYSKRVFLVVPIFGDKKRKWIISGFYSRFRNLATASVRVLTCSFS